jgi:hypothetical protein
MPLGRMTWSRTHRPQKPTVAGWAWNTEHVPDANTIFLAHCEDNAASTVVTDSSGNGYNGVASANTNTLSAAGKFNLGLNLGAAQNIDVNSNAMDTAIIAALNNKCTIEGWFKNAAADWSVFGEQMLLCFRTDGANFIFIDYDNTVNKIYFRYMAIIIDDNGAYVDTTAWQSMAMTVDNVADEVKAFVNGVLINTAVGVLPYVGAVADFKIGSYWNGGVKWNGIVDENAVSNVERY